MVSGVVHDATAQTWPARPLRWIVPYPPGGSFDAFSRILATHMAGTIAQQVVVENRVGAGGIIGTEAGVKSPADGYTLLSGDNGTLVYNPLLYRTLPYDPERDLEPVGLYARVPLFISAGASSGIRSLAQLVERAKAAPGKVTHASSGNGSPQHLAMELFKRRAGIDMLHVPYKGLGAAMQDLLAGRIDVSILPLGSVRTAGGKLVPLANTDDNRLAALPDVPTVAASGHPGFQAVAWWMLLVPAGTPGDVIQRLSDALALALADPEVQRRGGEHGTTSPRPTPAEARELIARERALWTPLIRSLGITLD